MLDSSVIPEHGSASKHCVPPVLNPSGTDPEAARWSLGKLFVLLGFTLMPELLHVRGEEASVSSVFPGNIFLRHMGQVGYADTTFCSFKSNSHTATVFIRKQISSSPWC